MANPLVRSGTNGFPQGPGGTPDNITSLPSANLKGVGVVSPTPVTSPVSDWIVGPIRIMTGTTAATGTIELHLVMSVNNSVYTGGVSPSATTDQSTTWTAALAADPNISPIQTIITTATANTSYYFREFSLVGVLGYLPDYWSLMIYNKTGAALNATATNHSMLYISETYV